jgi:ureidoglycolate dehydrogenase (NAD+)
MPETRTISKDDLEALCVDILTRRGVPEEDARTTARTQVHADLRGVHSHGARGIAGYAQQIESGATNPTPKIDVIAEGGAYVHLDGDSGLGQVVSNNAMTWAIEKAKQSGIGFALVRNSNHYGAAAYYAIRAAEADTVGFNCTGGRKLSGNMAAFGSIEPVIGNYPFAYGIPACDEHPVVLDMATGVVAEGKIAMARARDESIPEGWALTKEGLPTTDPAQASIIVPLGPKGSGLSIVMNVIGGILGGAGFPDRELFGHFFIAIDVAVFGDPIVFKAEIDERIASIRAARPAPGVDRVFYPGEPEWLTYESYLAGGIPMLATHLSDLEALVA